MVPIGSIDGNKNMEFVQSDEITFEGGTSYREGSSRHKLLLEGKSGSPGNYSLVIAECVGRYSPRHRHNFEQIRFQIEGEACYGRAGKLSAGMVGYYPEAVHYGPQTQDAQSILSTLVLQCGGASGSGYISRKESDDAVKALNGLGSFKNGVFKLSRDVDGLVDGTSGKRNLDAAQAIWEYVNKKPMIYPVPSFKAPLLIDPTHYEWKSLNNQPGVAERRLGTFTPANTAIKMVKVSACSHLQLTGGRDIYFVYQGIGQINNTTARFGTTIYLEPKENLNFTAKTDSVLLNIHLPDLQYIKTFE